DGPVSSPAVPVGDIAELDVLAADAAPAQLGGAGAVDRDGEREDGGQPVGLLEPERARGLGAQRDRPRALGSSGGWRAVGCRGCRGRAVPGGELVRDYDVDEIVRRRRKLVENQ